MLADNGFQQEETWGELLMRRDDISCFIADGYFMLSQDFGKGNGTLCLLQGKVTERTIKDLTEMVIRI